VSKTIFKKGFTMYTAKDKAAMLICEKDSRYYLVIPFDLKDSLKSAIPSVKFNFFQFKEWSVSLRSHADLVDWVVNNYDSIIKANLITAKRELTAGTLVLVENAFDIKENIKLKFNAIFGEFDGVKGWFVRPEYLAEANILRDQALLDLKADKQKPNDADDLKTLIIKFEKAIEDFKVSKEDPNLVKFGFSASYVGDNSDIKTLIINASKIIMNNAKLAQKDPEITTFNEATKDLIRFVSSKHNSFMAVESVVYKVMLNLLKIIKKKAAKLTFIDSGYRSENEIITLISDYFKLNI
jgi:hypothetical protein